MSTSVQHRYTHVHTRTHGPGGVSRIRTKEDYWERNRKGDTKREIKDIQTITGRIQELTSLFLFLIIRGLRKFKILARPLII